MHFPVLNRAGETVTTAVTSTDVHDLARSAAMFDVAPVYFVHPSPDMHALVRDIAGYWLEGAGGRRNPGRRQALAQIRLAFSLQEVLEETRARAWYTSASPPAGHTRPVEDLAGIPGRHLLVFGTGWGLDACRLPAPTGWLSPIAGTGMVRHLSVRAALAIYLDRLRARR